jgi:hypothetical protein
MRFVCALSILWLMLGAGLSAQEVTISRSGAVGCQARDLLDDQALDELSEEDVRDIQKQLIKAGKCIAFEAGAAVVIDRLSGGFACVRPLREEECSWIDQSGVEK